MSKVATNHKAHAHKPSHGHKPKPKPGAHKPNKPAANITNFNQQAMDQQMLIWQMRQAQMIQQFNAGLAGLQQQLQQGGVPNPQQVAAQAQAEQQAQAQQAAFTAYQTQAIAQFQATGAALQGTFSASMQQGFGSLESSLGGFLNQGFSPAQFNGGAYALSASSSLFSGPIAVPTFYGNRRY
ncbi:MAG: hypothetical protein KF760_02945 [Candidatus Eremiobacteraeota bacterium]|nr:hypothetical protein [Candidatus Eremiobacteraeota bacterium]MCW5870236.1 hypothetical protein [Candidatus Eremiobacteraeota bacterium]